MALFEKKSIFRKFIDSITMAVYDNPELGPEFLDQLEGCGLSRFMELGQIGVDQYADRLEGVQEIDDDFWNN